MKSSAQSTVSLPGDVLISSWEELQSKLYEGSWQGHLERFRSPFAFRGVPNANSPPETGLRRLGAEYVRCEQSLLRNFRKYAHRNAIHFDSLWNWMALAQHHGLPTRLLDWTFSPYVALHFATVNRTQWNYPAAIWCVDCVKIKNFLPSVLKRMLNRKIQMYSPSRCSTALPLRYEHSADCHEQASWHSLNHHLWTIELLTSPLCFR
jgi:FRG domain